jgi:ubiquinone/menaquinone biosynthesis C-methylase UbiE
MDKPKKLDFISINKKLWNDRVDTHLQSDFYDNDAFISGKTSLNDIELGMLGDIQGKSILHLQCHFGQDTISLNRAGAAVTGVDFAEQAIEAAIRINEQLGTSCKFVCCNVYDLKDQLDEQFDMVFTTYGTIGWLPDLDKWAEIVSHFLRPGGQFVFVEFHPVVWMFDDQFREVAYNYLNSGPIHEQVEGTYADRDKGGQNESVGWNHGISEVVNNLIKHGLSIKAIDEYDYSPYNCFSGTEEPEPGKFRIKHLKGRIPMVYGVLAEKG